MKTATRPRTRSDRSSPAHLAGCHAHARVGLPPLAITLLLLTTLLLPTPARADQLRAGAAKVEITNRDAGPVNDPLYVKALVLKNDATSTVIITVDAVALAEIGYIPNDYVPTVRAAIQKELGIDPTHVLINASHCHGVVRTDVAQLTLQAVHQAAEKLEPVTIGVGHGHEDRVQANRRLKLKAGGEADVRHAYSLPPDDAIAAVGPIDPEIGVLRLDRRDGRTLAVVFNFACHPIQGVPGGGNTADLAGFACQVIEDNTGPGSVALFLQGCAGDINPARYKDVNDPRDAETLGNLLGLSTLKALRNIQTRDDTRVKILNQTLALPRADFTARIAALEARRQQLLKSLTGTSLNFETFMPLYVKYHLSPEFPSYYSHRYLHEQALGRNDLAHLDAENRRNMAAYLQNIYTMEELTRLQTNLALLHMHQAAFAAADAAKVGTTQSPPPSPGRVRVGGQTTSDLNLARVPRPRSRGRAAAPATPTPNNNAPDPDHPTLTVELVTLRLGDFVLTTFPGELTVQIGLNIKKASPHPHTFVAGYTNGYIYYAPTTAQLMNPSSAQEDCDTLLAPPWQPLYEAEVAEMLREL